MPLFREKVLAAQGSLNITAPQAGILLAVPVSEGQTVKTGEVLLGLNTERHSLLNGAVGDISARVALQIEARQQTLTTERTLRELQTRQREQMLADRIRIRILQAEQRQADEERSLQQRHGQLARNTLATLVPLANPSKGAPPAALQAHGRLCGSRLNRVPALCRLPLSILCGTFMHPAADKLNDRSLSNVWGNLYGVFVGGLLAVVSVRLHFYIYGTTPKEWLQTLGVVEVLGWLFVSMLAHEGMHGLAWKLSNIRNPDIRIQFGFSWKACAFFTRVIGSMPVRSYIFGSGAPGVLLGLLPVLVGLLTGYIPLTILGSLNIAGAGSDFIVLWLTRKVSKNSWVIDHPSRLGFMTIEAAPCAVASPVTLPLRT